MVIKPLINLKNLRSAVAFFFLFFLHGISIGNGQQGISYNVKNNRSLPMRLVDSANCGY